MLINEKLTVSMTKLIVKQFQTKKFVKKQFSSQEKKYKERFN